MRRWSGLTLIWLCAAIALRADTLTFSNGDTLTGTLQRADAAHCVFASAMGGTVTVPWSNIQQLQTTGTFVAVALDGSTLTGQVEFFGSTIQVTVSGQQPQFMSRSDMRLIVDPTTYKKDIVAHAQLWQAWRGTASGGFSAVSATQSSIAYTTNIAFQRPVPRLDWLPQRSDTLVHFQGTYGKLTQPGEPTVKTSIFSAGLEQDQDLSAHLFIFANAQLDHNYSQGLELQQAYGSGAGWKLIETRPTQLDVKADLHWTRQRFLSGVTGDFLASSFTENLKHNLGKLVWTENLSLTPSYTNGLAYQMSGMSQLALPVYKALSLNIQLVDNYLNNPQPGFQKNSLQFSTGIQLSVH